MLGFYENFPEIIHGIAQFATHLPNKKLQQALTETLLALNDETFSLEDIGDPSIPSCTVNFESGIAEGIDFNYIDREQAERMSKTLSKNPFQTMDFLCIARYYKVTEEKKIPLKFDYYMLRCTFSGDKMETRIFHEKGPRYTSPEDILNFIANKVNGKAQKKLLERLKEEP